MLYADSCYLVKYYFSETGSVEVRKLFAGQQIACLSIGQAEVAAAFHRKFREGNIDSVYHSAATKQFQADHEAKIWSWLPLTPELLNQVGSTFAKLSAKTYLRTLDALHLAAAQSEGLTEIFTNDRHMLAAAPIFGLRGIDVTTK